jgi:hypothetical protein
LFAPLSDGVTTWMKTYVGDWITRIRFHRWRRNWSAKESMMSTVTCELWTSPGALCCIRRSRPTINQRLVKSAALIIWFDPVNTHQDRELSDPELSKPALIQWASGIHRIWSCRWAHIGVTEKHWEKAKHAAAKRWLSAVNNRGKLGQWCFHVCQKL